MNKVKQLDNLIARAQKINATRTETSEPVSNDSFAMYIGKGASIKKVNVDATQYDVWRADVEKFLSDNGFTGFVGEKHFGTFGNYSEFEEQYKSLQRLKKLDLFLGSKLTFKAEDMVKHLLRILATGKSEEVGFLTDMLALAVSNRDVNDTLIQIHREGLMTLNFSFGSNGHRLWSKTDPHKFLTLKGQERLEDLCKATKTARKKNTAKPATTVKRQATVKTKTQPTSMQTPVPPVKKWPLKRIIKWVAATILAGAAITISVYFTYNNNSNNQITSALNNSTISGSEVHIEQKIYYGDTKK